MSRSLLIALMLGTALLGVLLAGTAKVDHQSAASPGTFWRILHFEGVQAEHYDGLESMTASADAVVLGSISSVSPSRSWVAAPELGDDGIAYYVKASIQVESVLGGTVVAGDDGTVALELFLPNWKDYPDLASSVSPARTVFFLRRKTDTDLPYYRLVTITQGYFIDDGHIEPPIGADDAWVLDLHEKRFEFLLDRISRA